MAATLPAAMADCRAMRRVMGFFSGRCCSLDMRDSLTRWLEFAKICETRNLFAISATSVCLEFTEQILRPIGEFLWFVLDQVNRRFPIKEICQDEKIATSAINTNKSLACPFSANMALR